MKKVLYIYRIGILFIITGIFTAVSGLINDGNLLIYIMEQLNISFLSLNVMLPASVVLCAAGIIMICYYMAKSRTWICRECYMRFDAVISDILFGIPAGKGCRYIYCSKCRKKTICKPKKLVMTIHYF